MAKKLTELAKGINDKKDFSTLAEIYLRVSSIKVGSGDKFKRTAEQIIEQGLTGCTDYGLVFAALARYKGIPAVFLQAANIDWIKDLKANNENANFIRGHILIEVFIGDKWYLVDSTSGDV